MPTIWQTKAPQKAKDTAANPSGTLYDYPTSELKNLAKEYNLAYYINNIERLQKAELVDAIMDHMAWKKEQEEVDNRVQFKKSLKGVKLNYDKTRDKKDPRQRLNYKEIKEAQPVLQATHREVPKYKGKKTFGATHVKELTQPIQEVLAQEKIPSTAEMLSMFRKLTEVEQKRLIANLGLTEAEVLPAGVPALGEMEAEDEKEVVTTLHDVIAQLQPLAQQNAGLTGIEVVPKAQPKAEAEGSKLEKYKATLGPTPKSWKGYFANVDGWRYVRIAEMLLKNPGLSQAQIGKALEKEGWTVGTSQSYISRQLTEIKKRGFLEKPKAETPKLVVTEKAETPKNTIVNTQPSPKVAEQPKPKAETPKLPPLSSFAHELKFKKIHTTCLSAEDPNYVNIPKDKPKKVAELVDFMNYLEDVRARVFRMYKEDADTPKEKEVLKTLNIEPFFIEGELFVGIQGDNLEDQYAPNNKEHKYEVYYWDKTKKDISYSIGYTKRNQQGMTYSDTKGFAVKIDSAWLDNREHHYREERDLVKLLDELKTGREYLTFSHAGWESEKHYWYLMKDGFPLATEMPKPHHRPEIPKTPELRGGLLVDAKHFFKTVNELQRPNTSVHKDLTGQYEYAPREKQFDDLTYGPDISKHSIKVPKLEPDEDGIEQLEQWMRGAEKLAHVLENVNPAEALGWRVIYHELYEMINNTHFVTLPSKNKGVKEIARKKSSKVPATADPDLIHYFKQNWGDTDVSKPTQYNHAQQIEWTIMKALHGLDKVATNFQYAGMDDIPGVEEKLATIQRKYFSQGKVWQQLQHEPAVHRFNASEAIPSQMDMAQGRSNKARFLLAQRTRQQDIQKAKEKEEADRVALEAQKQQALEEKINSGKTLTYAERMKASANKK